jgi:hypothetical protein
MASAKQGEADPRTTHSAQRRKKAIEQSRFKTARRIRHELRFITRNPPHHQYLSEHAPINT